MLGHPQQRVQTVHPLEPEPPPDRLERVEVGLGALRGYSDSSSSSAR